MVAIFWLLAFAGAMVLAFVAWNGLRYHDSQTSRFGITFLLILVGLEDLLRALQP